MKAYTDIEQSKKLAEILPVESADMFYRNNGIDVKLMWEHNAHNVKYPCWSLAALLNILNNRAYSINEDAIVSLSSYKTVEWDLSISNSGLYMITKSDPIDACVEMIVKLKEKDLL